MDTTTRDLTAALLPAFPGFGGQGRLLARALLARLAQGYPVSLGVLAGDAGMAPELARAHLQTWWGLRYDSDGRVIGSWGLDLFPTRHRLRVTQRDLFAWCAWDALFLPGLIGEEAEVTSLCPATGDDIRLRVAPAGILDAEPEDARLALGIPAPGAAGADARRAFCRDGRFLADAQAAAEWRRGHPRVTIVSLDEGHRLGRAVWAALLGEPEA